VPISRIRAIDLDRLYRQPAGLRGPRRTAAVAPLGPVLPRVMLRQALAQAKRSGLLSVNPAEDATSPKERRREITPPSVAGSTDDG
jgi:hypothetical protein